MQNLKEKSSIQSLTVDRRNDGMEGHRTGAHTGSEAEAGTGLRLLTSSPVPSTTQCMIADA